MIIDTITIIGAVLALVVTCLTIVFNPFRRRCHDVAPSPSSDIPMSLVIVTHGDAAALEQCLPQWLAQRYDAELQIIVVVDEGDHLAEDIIKRIDTDKRIYSTFVPKSSRYMSRTKLAVTLGVKAARHEWVMLTNADCKPSSAHTLQALAAHCSVPDTSMVMGLTRYDAPCRGFYQFEHLHRALYFMHAAFRGKAYSTNSDCLIFRKDRFLQGQGFLGTLHLIMGEFENIVNRYAVSNETQVAACPESQLVQQAPSISTWRSIQVSALETRSHLHHGAAYRLLYTADRLFFHLSNILLLALTVYGAATGRWIILATSVLMLLTTLVMRLIFVSKVLKTLQIHISLWLVPLYELRTFWHNLFVKIKHWTTDKSEFTSHKL